MHFAMVTTFYPPYHFGGDGTYIRALSKELVTRGHQVSIIHCIDAYELSGAKEHVDVSESEIQGIRIIRLKSNFGFLSPLITQLTGEPGLKSRTLKDFFSESYDVVNFHNISLIGGPGIVALSRAAVNLYTLHEHWLLCPTHIFWKNKRRACDKRDCFRCSIRSGIPPQLWRYTQKIKRMAEHIDCFIAPSQFTAEQHRLGGISQNIKVMPLFSYLSPCDHQDLSNQSLSFLTVGRVTASKGIGQLVEAFANWPQFRLTVVGDGDQLPSLRDKFGHLEHIHFQGQLPQKTLISLYQKSTALILPSLAPETFGLTVVEAFACGTPAIVRIAGGNRETIDQSEAGFLYKTNEELLAILVKFQEQPRLRARLGKKARKAYENNYTREVHVSNYLTLVEQLLQFRSTLDSNACASLT